MTDQKHSPLWQGLRPSGKTLDNGQPEPGRPIIINCQQTNPDNCHVATPPRPDNRNPTCPGLCNACTDDLRRVLADVPLLLDDLDIAIAGETRFVEHGTRNGSTAASASGGNQAIAAHQRLVTAIMKAAGWFDTNQPELVARGLLIHLNQLSSLPETRTIALDISSAASRAHKVIDAPPEMWFYGACPDCGLDIWQERIHHESTTPVHCRCGYTSDLTSHQKRLLAAGEDRWLTLDELVGAIATTGIPITRDQIKGWIRRDGLPREKTHPPPLGRRRTPPQRSLDLPPRRRPRLRVESRSQTNQGDRMSTPVARATNPVTYFDPETGSDCYPDHRPPSPSRPHSTPTTSRTQRPCTHNPRVKTAEAREDHTPPLVPVGEGDTRHGVELRHPAKTGTHIVRHSDPHATRSGQQAGVTR